jgi:hypothetical protein
MQALGEASNSLESLTKNTNHFSEWWGTVRRELSNVQKDIGTIRNSEQRIGAMEKHWRLLNENFKRHMDQVRPSPLYLYLYVLINHRSYGAANYFR